nr:probable membrane-associated kinase regulator 4 [Ipomoea batatas]GMC89086.1 probable membrane-associated kinase regulator 4 [Ipomoea batatas]
MQKSLLPMNICMQKPFLPINSMITMQRPLFLPTNISMQRNFHFSGQTSNGMARNNHSPPYHVSAAEDDEYIDIEVNSFSPQSTDFEFQMPSSLNDNKELTMLPADDLFYKGKLLPLLLPPRLQTVQNLLKTTPKHQEKKHSWLISKLRLFKKSLIGNRGKASRACSLRSFFRKSACIDVSSAMAPDYNPINRVGIKDKVVMRIQGIFMMSSTSTREAAVSLQTLMVPLRQQLLTAKASTIIHDGIN